MGLTTKKATDIRAVDNPDGLGHGLLPMNSPIPWSRFLTEVLDRDLTHYLWLRSLSYLEYIGYRKMVKALQYQEVSRGVYHHLSDEIQHSYLLKELAEKSFEGKFFHVPLEEAFIRCAESYFHDIDDAVHRWVEELGQGERPFLCYLLVSYLIEKRAMIVYPQYYSQAPENTFKLILQKIIRDERAHLNYLEDHLAKLPEAETFESCSVWPYETERFEKFLGDFAECLG